MKSYGKISLLLTAFIFSAFQSFGQEICANGIDDDGDGFVDCYDGDCADGVDCADFYVGNSVFCKDEPTDNPTFAIRLQWGSADRTANSHATPMVGDIDQDGTPEVIASNKQARTLTILDGVTGALDANVANNPINLSFQPENVPVLADFDGDGCAEILVNEDRGNGDIALIDCQGNILWQEVAGDHVGVPGIADFNEDGNPEIYYRDEIRDVNGNVIVSSSGGDWEIDWVHGPIAVDILPDGFCADCGGLELITGNEIWAVNIAAGTKTLAKDLNDLFAANGESRRYHPKYFQNWDDQWSAISVADFDQDGDMDILMPGAFGSDYRDPTTIFFWDPNEDQILTYADPTNDHPRGTGRINIADVNGDGRLNAAYVSDQILYALNDDMTALWRKGIKEGSSGFTGCTLFDFDGDGASETVYRSESELLIIDGTDGSTRRAIACVSRTQEEYPIVADVDNDGSSEICVTCYTNNTTPFNPYSNTEFAHVRVYEADGGEIWQPSRRVWNQHGYFNVNINDDLTVPVQMQDHTSIFGTDCEGGTTDNRPLNSFLNQSTFLEEDGCPSYVSPDLNLLSVVSASSSQCPLTTFDVTFDIRNDGDTDISGSLPITFYAGDPTTAGATRLNTEVIVINNFQIGETRTLTATVEGPGGDVDLYMIINDNGSDDPPVTLTTSSIPECSTENNIGQITATYEPFPLSIEKLADNRKCDDALPDNGRARAFYFGEFGGGIETVWIEDFQDLANGTTTDNGETAWSFTGGKSGARTIAVDDFNGGRSFVGNNTGGSNESNLVTWTSESIDITDLQDVSVSIDLMSATSGHEGASSQWRDLIRVYYILDGGARVLMNNGEHYGNYIFQQATVGNLTGNTIQIEIELHNTANSEFNVFDNVLVQGFRPPEEREYTEADGFTFEWFAGTDFSAPVHTGSNYADMAEGTYSVVGFSTDANCASDTLTVNIDRVIPQYEVLITEVSPLTDCATPNGELFAQAVELDQDGDPVDTLTTGYEFTWLASDLVTTLATGPTLANQTNGTYTVNVLNTTTGCPVSASADISTQLVRPDLPTAAATDVTSCVNLNTGEVSANVNGNTTDYTFEWYEGTGVSPTPDFTGDTWTGVPAGDYTVVAVDNTTSCESDPVTVTVNNPTAFPTPVATATSENSSCGAFNGSATVDGDGAGTVAGYSFTWYAGDNEDGNNLLPGATGFGTVSISADGSTATGMPSGIYRIVVEDDATGCTSFTTVEIVDDFTEPEFVNIETPVNTGNAIQFTGTTGASGGQVTIPQMFGAGNPVTDQLTVQYWANISANNYAGDHRIFSSGATGENQVLLWSDNHDGLAFVVKTTGGGRGRINSSYSATGWVQVTGTWDGTTGEMRMYADGVLLGTDNHVGSGVLRNAGPNMFLGRDAGSDKKFEGVLDEVRIYNRVLSIEEINEKRCGELDPAQETGLVGYYDFNNLTDNSPGASIPNLGSAAGFDGTIAGNAGNTTFLTADITCVDANVTDNYSCDAANPTGGVDLSANITPPLTDDAYTFSLYDGFSIAGAPEATSTDGTFTSLSEGFYTIIAESSTTGCVTTPVTVSINDVPDIPQIAATPTADTFCGPTGNGTINVTPSSRVVEPSTYTVELFDGANTDPANLVATESVNGGDSFLFENLTEGTYRIRVTNDDITCENTSDVIILDESVNPAITTTADFDNRNCVNPDGQVQVTGVDTDGLSDYSFTWYSGSVVDASNELDTVTTGNVVTNLPAGSYTVVATSSITGCETAPVTLTIIDNPTFPDVTTLEVQPQSGCNPTAGADGIARAYAEDTSRPGAQLDETAGYSFQWYEDAALTTAVTNGDTSRVDSLAQGTYFVEVTDESTGCVTTASVSIGRVPIEPILSTNSTVPNTACDPTVYDGEILVDVSFNGSNVTDPVTDGYTFEWFYSDGTAVADGAPIAGATTNNPTGLGAGTYEVIVTAPNGCVSDALFVTVTDTPTLPVPVAVEEEPNTSCAVGNGIAAITSVNGGSPNVAEFSYEWFLGSNTNSANALPGTANVNAFLADDDPFRLGGLDPGIYTVRITSEAANGGNGCVEIVTVEITDAAEDPLQVDENENDIDVTAQTTCDPNNYGGSIDISAAVDGTTDAEVGNENGSFEVPGLLNNPNTGDFNPISNQNNFFGFPSDVNHPGAGYYSEDLIPGWVTDDPWGVLEIWRTGNDRNSYVAYDGDHWAELNSQFASALYFDVNTVPGTTMIWRFAHRGRNDQDCMDLNIGPSNDPTNLTTISNFCSETVNTGPNTENGWAIYEGTYVVPDGQYSTRFEYRSTDPSNPVEGNFIDGVEFFIDPFTFEGELADGSGTVINDPENDGLFENLPAGEYQFTVRDNYTGCESDIIYVTVPDETQRPDFAYDATNPVNNSVCDVAIPGGFNGAIELLNQGAGAVSDYTFTWYEGPNTSNLLPGSTGYDVSDPGFLRDIPGGTYTVEIQNTTTLCDTTFQVSIVDEFVNTVINEVPDVSVRNDSTCNSNSGVLIVDASGFTQGSGNYTYRRYDGSTVSATPDETNTAGTFTGLAPGEHTIEVVDNETGCISVPVTETIIEEPLRPDFQVTSSGDNSVCDLTLATPQDFNGFISVDPVDVSEDVADFTYEWFVGGGTNPANRVSNLIPTASGFDSDSLAEIPGGTYTVLITDVSNNSNGCTNTLTFAITDAPEAIAITGSPANLNVCVGNAAYPNGGVDLTTVTGGSGNFSYEWYFGNGVNASRLLDDADGIFTQKGTSGTASVNVSGSSTANVSGLNPGTYTVRAFDIERGCYSAPYTFTVGEDPSGLSITSIDNLVDNYSCDMTSPIGEARANGTGAATPRYEWYAGNSATGTILQTTQTAIGLPGGTYTVKYIDDATNCFVTDQVTIEDFEADITATLTPQPQDECNPANGSIQISGKTVTWSPAGAPDGYTAPTYTYEWYLGNGTSTPIIDGVDPGNGSIPAITAGGTQIDGLVAGTYSVRITDSESGCESALLSTTVVDDVSGLAPDLEFDATAIPGACDATVGAFRVRFTASPTNNFAFEFYEGAQDFASIAEFGDGTELTTGESLANYPSATVTVNTTVTNGIMFVNDISGLGSGVYTVVVTDQVTGCRYQESFNLPFNDQQTTTTITIENVDQCPANGVARVGLEDDLTNPGYVLDDVDDIAQYILYLYAGDGIPANRLDSYVYEGITFPLKYDAANGEVLDGDDNLFDSSVPVLGAGDEAVFENLPAGPYIAVAREIPNTSFGSISQCFSEASLDREIIDVAYAPVVNDTDVIANSVCDISVPGTGNGQLSVTVVENPEENNNPAEFRQPAGYRFTWTRISDGQVVHEEEIFTETATSTTSDTLSPDNYRVEIFRAFESSDVTYSGLSGVFEDGESVTFSGGATGVIVTDDGSSSMNIYVTTNPTGVSGTVTGIATGATANVTSATAGATVENGCTVFEDLEIPDMPEVHDIINANVVDITNCDLNPNPTITVNDNDIVIGTTGQPVANYTFEWFKGSTTNSISGTYGSTNSIDLSTFSPQSQIADLYYVVATSTINGCSTPPFEIDLRDLTVEPTVNIVDITDDTSCDPDLYEGLGSVTFELTNAPSGNYSYTWFDDATDTPLPTASTEIVNAAGTLDGTETTPYQIALQNVDAGTYRVEIVDLDNPNRACAVTTTVTVNEITFDPDIFLTPSYVLIGDNENCVNPNGFIEIIAVNEGGTDVPVDGSTYTFQWFDESGADITSSAVAGVTATGNGNRIDLLDGQTYSVLITNTVTECVSSAQIEIPVEDVSVNPTTSIVSRSADTYCDDQGLFIGDGSLEIAINEDGSPAVLTDYDNIVWYRGAMVTAGNEIFPNNPGSQRGSSASANDNLQATELTGLSAGEYTVVIRKSTGQPENAGCDVTRTFTIDSNPPTITIQDGDYAITNNDNCAGAYDGAIEITQIRENADIFDMSTDAGNYNFDWTGPNSFAVNGDGLNEITGLEPGEYVLNVTNLTTGCPDSDQDYTFVVGDDAVEPVVQFEARTPDTYCVAGGGFDGDGTLTVQLFEDGTDITGPAGADWTIEWYRGNAAGNPGDANFLYDNQGSASGSDVGTAILGADILSLEGLTADFYTISVTKTTDPNNLCAVTATFEVISNPNTLTIDPAQDIVFDNNFNCDNPNGFIEVTNVREDGDPNAYTLDNYSFTWAIDGNAFVDPTDGDIVNAGPGLGNRIEGLQAGVYTVTATNNVTGCVISDAVEIEIDDLSVNPEINFLSKTTSEGCDFTGNDGSGTLAINVTEDGNPISLSDYTFTWYRGEDVLGGQQLFTVANQGTADETTAGDPTALEGLAAGFYTLMIEKNGGTATDPNFGCEAVRTFEILEEQNFPNLNIPEAQIVHNTLCTFPGNGQISIDNDDITIAGAAGGFVDDFDWSVVSSNGGSTIASIADSIAGVDAAAELVLSGLNPGTYTLTATSSLGCASAPFEVIILDRSLQPEIDQITVIPDADCGGGANLGAIEILAISEGDTDMALTDYTYQWYIGNDNTGQTVGAAYAGVTDTEAILTGVAHDNYTVEITNTATGCVTTQTVTIANEPEFPIITSYEVNDDLLCVGDNGSFNLIEILFNDTTYNADIAAEAARLQSEFTFTLTDAAGANVADVDPSTPFEFDSLAAGEYTFTVSHDASTCLSDPVSFVIGESTVIPSIDIAVVQADSTCGMPATPNAIAVATADGQTSTSGQYSFEWFDINNTPSTLADDTPLGINSDTLTGVYAGDYRLQVTNTVTGCINNEIVTIQSAPVDLGNLTVAGTDPTTCMPANGLVEVTAVEYGDIADYTFEFFVGDVNTPARQADANPRLENVEAGTYLVRATHTPTGCVTPIVQIELSDDNITYPTIALAFDALGEPVSKNNTSCDPAMPTGRLSVTANGSQVDSLYNFVWFDGNNTQIATGATLDSLRGGNYIVQVTNLATGCMSTEDYNIIDDVPPVELSTSASPNTNCVDPNGIVAATVINVGDNPEYRGAQNYSYYWFLTNVGNPEAAINNGEFVYTGPQVADLGSGIYYVVAQDDIVNCFISDPVRVEVRDETMTPMLEVNVESNLTICDPERPNGLVTIEDPNNNLGRYEIEWYVGTDTTGLMPFETGVFVDSLTIGQYSAVVTDRITGCVQVAPFEIMDETPVFEPVGVTVLGQRTNCQVPNGFARANVGGETLGFLFEWFVETDMSTPLYTGPEQRGLDTATYVVRATHVESGCVIDADTVEVRFTEIEPAFELDIENSICLRTEDGSTNQFSGQAFIQFEQFNELDTIVWFEGPGRTQQDEAFAISFNEKLIDVGPGEYSVWFRPNNGCDYYATFSIEAAIKIYNGVSANADGLNDFFLLDCIDVFENNNVQIFNRDGTKVWEADGYNNQDVRFAGVSNVGNKQRELPVGTYFFIIDKGDGSQLINGYLELVR